MAGVVQAARECEWTSHGAEDSDFGAWVKPRELAAFV